MAYVFLIILNIIILSFQFYFFYINRKERALQTAYFEHICLVLFQKIKNHFEK